MAEEGEEEGGGMIFKQWEQVLDGNKTQTRRIVKSGERCRDGITVSKYWISRFAFMPHPGEDLLHWSFHNPKWQVGRDYAIQPGRGKKAVGRVRITGIRRERLQDITPEDCRKEGLDPVQRVSERTTLIPDPDLADIILRLQFHRLWNSIHTRTGERFEHNPEVWVLTFEVVE